MARPRHLRDVAAEFPVLRREIDGHPLTYLDSAATSQTPQPVIDAMTRYYTESRASIHRGVYPLAVEATDLYEGARRRIAEWLGSTPRGDDLHRQRDGGASTSSPTRGAVRTWAAGDLVVLTEMEHHSNIVPWQLLCQDRDAELAYVPVLDDGQLDLDALDELLARGPKLVGVVHVSNVLGTINPVAEIVRRAHEAGAVVLIDGSQAVPQIPVDLRAIDADFYAWTGHKAYGPTGIGVLHGRRALLEEMPPFIGGGHMIRTVARQRVDVDRPAVEVRGRHLADRRGDRARRGRRLDPGARHRADPGPRGGAGRRGAGAPGSRFPASSSTARPPPPTAARWSRSRSTAPTRTTSARSSGARACASAAGHHCAQPLMRRLGVSGDDPSVVRRAQLDRRNRPAGRRARHGPPRATAA